MRDFKESMKETAIDKFLKGALIEEYTYNIGTRMIKFSSSTRLRNFPEGDFRIKSIANDESVDLGNNNDWLDLDYKVEFTKGGNIWNKFADIDIEIEDSRMKNCVPFKEYNVEDGPRLVGDGKEMCRLLKFHMEAKSYANSGQDISTCYHYEDIIEVGIPLTISEVYIYICTYIDGSLPTVLVCKDNFNILSDISNYLFINSNNIYNSYYHPHNYMVEEIHHHADVVYGSPYNILDNMKFNEIYNFNDDKDYFNTDKISCKNDHVYLDNWKIGNITENVSKIDLIEEISNGDYNDIYSETVNNPLNIEDICKLHPEFENIFCGFYNEFKDIEFEKRVTKFKQDSVYSFNDGYIKITYLKDIDGTEKSLLQYIITHKLEDDVKAVSYFALTSTGYRFGFNYNGDDVSIYTYNDPAEFVTFTNNRTISYSNSGGLCLIENGKFHYTVDNAGNIIDGNLPLDKDKKRNIFGF